MLRELNHFVSSKVRPLWPALLVVALAAVGAAQWVSVNTAVAVTLVSVAVLAVVTSVWRERFEALLLELHYRRLESATREAELDAKAMQIAEQAVLLDEKSRQLAAAQALDANVLHELRTPLNAAIGVSAHLLEGLHGPLTVAQQAALEDIRSAARHALNFVLDPPPPRLGRPSVRRELNLAMSPEVLVVDDDESTRLLLCRVLQSHGFSVRSSANGHRGIEALVEKLPRVLILDLMMPELDGHAVLERLRRLPGHEAVQIIVFTATQLDASSRALGPHVRVVVKGSIAMPELLAMISTMAQTATRSAA